MATKTYEEALKEQQKKTAELQKKLTTAVKNDEASKARYMGDIEREYNAINAGTYTPRFTNPSANRRPENSSVVRNNQYKAGSTSSLPSASSTVKIQNVSSFGTRGTSLQQVDNDDSFAAYQRVLNAQNRNTAGEKTVLDYYQNRVNGGHTPTEEEIRYAGAIAALIDEEREKGATEVDIVQLMNRAKAQEAARKQAEYNALSPAKKLVHDFEEVKQSSDYNRRVQQGKGLFETSPLGAPDLSKIPAEYRDYYYYLLSGSAQDVYKAQELLTYLQNTEQYEQENNPVGYYEDFAKKVSALKSRGDYDAVTQEGRAKTGGMIGDYATVDAMRNDPQRASTIDKGRRLLGEYADSRTANLTPEARDYYYWLIGSDMYGIANNILSNAQNADYYLETNNMTAEERNIYFAFVGAGDNENATKYLNSIKEQANMRRGENLSKQVENMAPGLRGAAAGALGVAGGVANVVSGIANAASMVAGNVMQQFTDADGFDKIILVPRDDLEYTANILNSSESLSKLGRMVANIGYQAGRMIPSVAVSAVAGAAGAPALATRLASIAPSFASLYGTTYGDALRNGDSNAQAAAYSLLNAVLETGLQYALGSIPGVSSGSGVLQNAVKNVGTRLAQHPGVMTALRVLANAGDEGLEEFLQEIIDPLARNIATGENNRLDAQTLENAAYSFLLGSLTGFLFEAPNISGEFADASVDAINAKMDTLKGNAYLKKLKGIEPIAADPALSQFAGAGTQNLGNRFRDRVQAAAPMQSVEALEGYTGNAAQSVPAAQAPTVMPQTQNAPVSEISPVAQGGNAQGASVADTAEAVYNFGKKFKVPIGYSTPSVGEVDYRGKLQDGRISINPNKVTTKAQAVSTIAHEATHAVRNTVDGAHLEFLAMDYFSKAMGASEKDLIDAKIWQARNQGINLDEASARQELAAEYIGALANPDGTPEGNFFADKIARDLTQNRNVFQKIYDFFADKVRSYRIKANLTEVERADFDNAMEVIRHLEAALQETKATLSLSEQYKAKHPGVTYSAADDFAGNFAAWKEQNPLQEQIDQYGAFPAGEIPARNIEVPQQVDDNTRVMRGVRTALESEAVPDSMVPETLAQISDGAFSYVPSSNKEAMAKARRTMEGGVEKAAKLWDGIVASDKIPSQEEIALGELLLATYAQNPETVSQANRLIAEVSSIATRAGQAVQAMKMLKRISGADQLYFIEKNIEYLQSKYERTHGDKQGKIELSEATKSKLLNAKTAAQKEAAREIASKEIGQQLSVSWKDRLDAWRYFAMLGNARTHFRNLVGNTLMLAAREVKNLQQAGVEATINRSRKAAGKQGLERHAAVLTAKDKSLRDFAKQDYINQQRSADSADKYSLASQAERDRELFGKTFFGKGLNAAVGFNSRALEAEDALFKRITYVDTMARYMKANNLTPEFLRSGTAEANEALQRAQNYATQQALEATFQEANDVASALSRFTAVGKDDKLGKKAVSFMVEGIVPFKKTPANILKQGVQYSPLGFVNVAADIYKSVKRGDSPAAVFDSLAKALTGTELAALGWFLAAQGMLTGGEEDDKEGKLKQAQGFQNYALHIGDTYYTLDWASPMAMPLFMAVELYEQAQNEKSGEPAESFIDSLLKIAEPMTEMSMLQGLNSAIENASYSEGDAIFDIGVGAATSYITQFMPTLAGQVARSIDPVDRRTSRYEGDLPSALGYPLNKTIAKIPGLNQTLQPYVDQWGRIEEREKGTGDYALAAFENFLSPGYITQENITPADEEVMRLYDALGESAILPDFASRGFTYDSTDYKLTGADYTQYAQTRGQTAFNLIEGLTESEAYLGLTDEQKAAVIKSVYDYSTYIAKKEFLGDVFATNDWEAKAYEKFGDDPETLMVYLAAKQAKENFTNDSGYVKGKNLSAANAKKRQVDPVMDGLTRSEREEIYEMLDISDKVW